MFPIFKHWPFFTYYRRERTAALNLSSEIESDFLADIEEQLTSPSSFYTGTGGKPPLSFTAVSDTKSNRKRYDTASGFCTS